MQGVPPFKTYYTPDPDPEPDPEAQPQSDAQQPAPGPQPDADSQPSEAEPEPEPEIESQDYDAAAPSAETVDAQAREVPPADLKCELYAAVASLNRGLSASSVTKASVNDLIEQLERQNPTEAPVDTPDLLVGEWRLLYTDALDILSLGLLAPVALVSEVYQNVALAPDDADHDFDVENIVELEPAIAPVLNAFAGRTMSKVAVKARGVRQSEQRVDISFVESALRQHSVVGMEIPAQLPSLRVPFGRRARPAGYIDTTYLDEDIRVVRAPPFFGQNNVFVLMRVQ